MNGGPAASAEKTVCGRGSKQARVLGASTSPKSVTMPTAFFKIVLQLAVLISMAGVASADPPTHTQEITLADPVRVAFYEAAPAALSAAMRRARDVACKDFRGSSTQTTASWLCDGTPLRYLRAVNVLGTKYVTGFVCRSGDVTPNLRYYTADMFEDGAACLPVSYSDKTKRNVVEVQQ